MTARPSEARALAHLIEIIDAIGKAGAGFQSLSESIDPTTAGGSLAFHMMGALVEFERSLIAERTKAGMRVLLSPSLGPAVAVRENYGRP